MAKMLDIYTYKNELIKWIQKYFEANGNPSTKAVIGISGGKDSTVAAALCVEALGKDRVVGIKMPNGRQEDIEDANAVIEWLGIESHEANIGMITDCFYDLLWDYNEEIDERPNDIVKNNLPARVRMVALYLYANQYGARVVCTGNYSEEFIGYFTRWGDELGDFAPLGRLLATQVIAIGRVLGVPEQFLIKPPHDGMCGQTDEDRFGFTYEELDEYILFNKARYEVKEKIDNLNRVSQYKRDTLDSPSIPWFPAREP